MTNSSVAADFLETLDVHSGISAELTFYKDAGLVESISDALYLVVREVLDTGIAADAGFFKKLVGRIDTDAVNIGKTDFYPLVSG